MGITKEEVIIEMKLIAKDTVRVTRKLNKVQTDILNNNKQIHDKTISMNKTQNKRQKQLIQEEITGLKTKQGALDHTYGKLSSSLTGLNNETNKGSAALLRNENRMDGMQKQFSGMLGPMKMTTEQFGEFTKGGGRFNTSMGRTIGRIRLATAGMKGFKMEFLGVMFFGMAMQRMFSGLLKPASEAFGMMELWGTMLTVLFIPTMKELFPYFLDLTTSIMKLDDDTKKSIGGWVIFGLVLGTILFVVGTLALGIGSLITMFGGALVVTMGLVVLALIGAAIAFVGVHKAMDNWGKDTPKTIDGIGNALIGLGLILVRFINWWALIPIGIGVALKLSSNMWGEWGATLKVHWNLVKVSHEYMVNGMIKTYVGFVRFMASNPITGWMWTGMLRSGEASLANSTADLEKAKQEEGAGLANLYAIKYRRKGDLSDMEFYLWDKASKRAGGTTGGDRSVFTGLPTSESNPQLTLAMLASMSQSQYNSPERLFEYGDEGASALVPGLNEMNTSLNNLKESMDENNVLMEEPSTGGVPRISDELRQIKEDLELKAEEEKNNPTISVENNIDISVIDQDALVEQLKDIVGEDNYDNYTNITKNTT